MVRAEHQFRRKIRNLTFDNAGVAEREKRQRVEWPELYSDGQKIPVKKKSQLFFSARLPPPRSIKTLCLVVEMSPKFLISVK
jgi:hypothetical protein